MALQNKIKVNNPSLFGPILEEGVIKCAPVRPAAKPKPKKKTKKQIQEEEMRLCMERVERSWLDLLAHHERMMKIIPF